MEENAVDWYLHTLSITRSSLHIIPNGSLYLITGCDKTQSLSTVAIPVASQSAGKNIVLQYRQGKIPVWSDVDLVRIHTTGPERNPGASYGVFIRGLRLSLSHRIWARSLRYTPPNYKPHFNILATPIIGRRARIIRRLEQLFGPRRTSLRERPKVTVFLMFQLVD